MKSLEDSMGGPSEKEAIVEIEKPVPVKNFVFITKALEGVVTDQTMRGLVNAETGEIVSLVPKERSEEAMIKFYTGNGIGEGVETSSFDLYVNTKDGEIVSIGVGGPSLPEGHVSQLLAESAEAYNVTKSL